MRARVCRLGEEEPQIVEDYGTQFFVGDDTAALNTFASSTYGIPQSFGHRSLRLRAKFLTILDYHRYPYDGQEFSLRLQIAAATGTSDHVVFRVTSYDAINASVQHPVWEVVAVNAHLGKSRFLPPYNKSDIQNILDEYSDDEPKNPFFLVAAYLSESSPSAFSYAQVTLRVKRSCGYCACHLLVARCCMDPSATYLMP